MKTKDKKIKDFDTVKTFREIKDKISKDIQGMNFEQLTAYLNRTKLKSQN
jgi:beta-lactam-binding protein with PASTA domain